MPESLRGKSPYIDSGITFFILNQGYCLKPLTNNDLKIKSIISTMQFFHGISPLAAGYAHLLHRYSHLERLEAQSHYQP